MGLHFRNFNEIRSQQFKNLSFMADMVKHDTPFIIEDLMETRFLFMVVPRQRIYVENEGVFPGVYVLTVFQDDVWYKTHRNVPGSTDCVQSVGEDIRELLFARPKARLRTSPIDTEQQELIRQVLKEARFYETEIEGIIRLLS